MSKAQVNCPRCHQPVLVEVEQLIDVNQDPLAKQKLLNGAINFIQCNACGFRGNLTSPIVYHDPEKELLLTYFPAELNVPLNQQEQQIGPLINRVMNNTPQEKRKAYMLRPTAMFTYQALIEKILESDGITKEMLEAQQQRLDLLQRLLNTPQDAIDGVLKQEESLIDIQFFSLFSRIQQAGSSQMDEKTNQALNNLQRVLYEKTSVGKQLLLQAKETESAIKILQDAGKDGLTREKLLEIILSSSSDTQLSIFVSLARSAFDYHFFQLLSERIEKSSGIEKEKFTNLRQKLLDICDQVDKRVNEHVTEIKKIIEEIITSDKVDSAVEKYLEKIDEVFLQVLEQQLSDSRKKGDLERINKLEQIMVFIEKISTPPTEIEFLEELLQFTDETDLDQKIEKSKEKVTAKFIELLGSVVAQNSAENQNDEIKEKLRTVHRAILRFSMRQNLNG